MPTGGTVDCWGNNLYGIFGKATSGVSSVPVPVTGPSGATALSLNGDSNSYCALLNGGTVQCWGDNQYGQLGNGVSSQAYGAPRARAVAKFLTGKVTFHSTTRISTNTTANMVTVITTKQ